MTLKSLLLACVLAGHTADAAILTEPTKHAIWTAQVGVLWFQVRVLGAPAHAGDAAEGANAIEASYAVIEALRDLEAEGALGIRLLQATIDLLNAGHEGAILVNADGPTLPLSILRAAVDAVRRELGPVCLHRDFEPPGM